MPAPAIGKTVPDFSLPATGGQSVRLSALRGGPVILYFYPKDDTPGCTLEGQDFRDQARAFSKLKAVVLGVSRDTLAAHEKFKAKHALPFALLADTDEKLCQLFDVIKDKNMYGRKVRGIERSTFLIDADGVLRQQWRGVKVKGHVAEVLESLQQL
jgi:thioredoxin-dependent peroxiredoxin